jgi:DNA-directed RNA polymerase specialized sigma24 family protein
LKIVYYQSLSVAGSYHSTLLERHRTPLYALVICILGHGTEAQDTVQDTFLVTSSSIDRLREPRAVSGWLRSILRNLCYTRLRRGHEAVLLDETSSRFEGRILESSAKETVDRL